MRHATARSNDCRVREDMLCIVEKSVPETGRCKIWAVMQRVVSLARVSHCAAPHQNWWQGEMGMWYCRSHVVFSDQNCGIFVERSFLQSWYDHDQNWLKPKTPQSHWEREAGVWHERQVRSHGFFSCLKSREERASGAHKAETVRHFNSVYSNSE
jgi:hypothetical protein